MEETWFKRLGIENLSLYLYTWRIKLIARAKKGTKGGKGARRLKSLERSLEPSLIILKSLLKVSK